MATPQSIAGRRLLAIETATGDVAVAVAECPFAERTAAGRTAAERTAVEGTAVLAAASCRAGRGHAERLHLMVASVLDMSGLTLGDLDGVAVDIGPGLFTGIRVGVAAAKGYGLGLGIPLVGMTSLEVLAHAASGGTGSAVAVVDLRRGEVAWRLPAASLGGQPAVFRGKPDDLLSSVRQHYGAKPVLLAGDGALRYAEVLRAGAPDLVVAGPEMASAPVSSLAVRGLQDLVAGKAKAPAEIAPVYLRDADVRIKWSTRHDSGRAGGSPTLRIGAPGQPSGDVETRPPAEQGPQ
ncbi:MAG: tRNA (adenosine(37)-N6)-threonylcarbamoyltransferase complex dimerization subunit type 1 TsaB [Acidimicrobiales bacterium]